MKLSRSRSGEEREKIKDMRRLDGEEEMRKYRKKAEGREK